MDNEKRPKPFGTFLPYAPDLEDRISFKDMQDDITMRLTKYVDLMPAKEWFDFYSGIPVPNSYHDGLKDSFEHEEKQGRKFIKQLSGDVYGKDGKKIKAYAGLSPMQISQLRKLFELGEGDEISYYFPQDQKNTFFNKDGSINLSNYLLLKYCDIQDKDIYEYFGIKLGVFKYFKRQLKKTVPDEGQLKALSKQAYDNWEASHPKVQKII